MSAAELEAIRERLEKHADTINALDRKHTELKGKVELVVSEAKSTRELIIENRETRDAQHAELLKIATDLEKKVGALRTAEDQREGMKAVAKGAAIAVTIVLGLIGIYRFLIG